MYPPRTLARVSTAGFVAAAIAVLAGVAIGRPVRDVNTLVFSLGALVFGFGLSSWASALLLGNSLDMTASLADLDRDWSSADIADAMSLLTAFGAGVMVGGALLTELIASVI
jgi:hypothetical protein